MRLVLKLGGGAIKANPFRTAESQPEVALRRSQKHVYCPSVMSKSLSVERFSQIATLGISG